ncbi:MAG TPA: tripartite tricarboxylate transporter substrate binding protein [Pseudolabrys sp.]|jgi:tripartite-type tricarboxylate transporter receptor subunit TctC|nr:tripartite tricarboxylate transporter substrate binding protein [Pseudolabrys sp.]
MSFQRFCLIAAFIVAAAASALAQDYPTRPVTIIVGYPAGTPVDTIARVIAGKLTERAGRPFLVENKPGAGSSIGAAYVAKAAPDGYTLYLSSIANTTDPSFNKLSFDFAKDLAPISQVCNVPVLLVVPPSGPATVAELIKEAKNKPGSLAFGSSGIGTATHLFAELFSRDSSIKLAHIPYKGSSQAVVDLLAGRIQMMFSPAGTVLQQVKSGKLIALAVSGTQRLAELPNVPTFGESGIKSLDFSLWFGLNTTARTPQPVIDYLNKQVAAVLDDPDIKAKLVPQMIFPVSTSSESFGAFIREDLDRWRRVVAAAGLAPKQ